MRIKKKVSKGFGIEMPPDKNHVIIYFMQKGFSDTEALTFLDYYKSTNWASANGSPVCNWKTAANDWIWLRFRKPTY